ncbi:MAG TPA: WYL domain-containing protein [Gaiellaceae bacterium]|nr:WYL domain-containing protein [Gaiellaceae bacterium]
MRASRLVSLLLLLQTRGQLTAAEIAERMEVSIRTVHRDVASLAAAGVPVEAVRGPAGGYRLAGGYRTRLTGLTADEAEALFAGMSGPVAELGLGHEVAAARLKLLAALPAELQERAARAERLFHLDTRGWFRAEDRVPHLHELSAAVWRGCRVRMRYREGQKTVRRTVDPLGLVLKGGAWYLVAHRSAGMRVYRVSRVASVRALDEECERPSGFELDAFWAEWSHAFEESLPRIEVVVRSSDGVKTLAFESLAEAHSAVLRNRYDVLEPRELRARVTDTVRELAAVYVQ